MTFPREQAERFISERDAALKELDRAVAERDALRAYVTTLTNGGHKLFALAGKLLHERDGKVYNTDEIAEMAAAVARNGADGRVTLPK